MTLNFNDQLKCVECFEACFDESYSIDIEFKSVGEPELSLFLSQEDLLHIEAEIQKSLARARLECIDPRCRFTIMDGEYLPRPHMSLGEPEVSNYAEPHVRCPRCSSILFRQIDLRRTGWFTYLEGLGTIDARNPIVPLWDPTWSLPLLCLGPECRHQVKRGRMRADDAYMTDGTRCPQCKTHPLGCQIEETL